MKWRRLIILPIVLVSFSILAKSKKKSRINLVIPNSINSNSKNSSFISPRINLNFFNSPAYGNLLLNQYEANIDNIVNQIPEPQSDLGVNLLNQAVQKEITNDLSILPIQSGASMPFYKVTNISDHGLSGKTAKFKNIDYLLWKFQNIEEGYRVEIKGNQLSIIDSVLFEDKPDTLIKFIQHERKQYLLIESKTDGIITGLLIEGNSKKAKKVKCVKIEEKAKVYFEFAVIGVEEDFKEYIALIGIKNPQ